MSPTFKELWEKEVALLTLKPTFDNMNMHCVSFQGCHHVAVSPSIPISFCKEDNVRGNRHFPHWMWIIS